MMNKRLQQPLLAIMFPLLLGLLSVQAVAQYDTPTETVRNMLDAVLGILRAPDFDLQRDRETIDTEVSGAFDPNTIAQSALGSNYRDLNSEQRAEFEALFFEVLKATYIDRLDAYDDETVDYINEEVDGNRGSVETLVHTSNSEISVNYSLRRRPNGWFIYDIIVEDVSLLSSYRSTYSSIIRRSGIDELFIELRAQAAELEDQ